MSIVLYYWSIQWRSVLFDVEKGVGKVRWFSKKPKECDGWANKHKGVWSALWNSDAGLVFQVGDKTWDINTFDCSHRFQGEKCIFEISKSGRVEYSLEYDAYAPKDVAFDDLDLESEDYFYWISLVWNNQSLKSEFLSSWDVLSV